MRFVLGCLLLALISSPAFAADISGKWTGNFEIKLPDGNTVTQPAWAEFRQKGQEISGTAGGGEYDESLEIENGKFDGKNVVFQLTGNDGRVYKANLTVAGTDRLEGPLDFALPDGTPMTAKLTLKRDEKRSR